MIPSYPPPSHPNSRFLIVVIDDSATVRKILETCLGREGFTVRAFPDGIEAMQWLASPQGRVPDLVILDLILPRMNSYQIARQLKSKPRYSNTIIIMLTRLDGKLDCLKGRLAGAKDYLTKPFEACDVLAIVKQHLNIQEP